RAECGSGLQARAVTVENFSERQLFASKAGDRFRMARTLCWRSRCLDESASMGLRRTRIHGSSLHTRTRHARARRRNRSPRVVADQGSAAAFHRSKTEA